MARFCAERLPAPSRNIGEERIDLRAAHLLGLAQLVEPQKASQPGFTRADGAPRVMACRQDLPVHSDHARR